MSGPSQKTPQGELLKKLQVLMLLRVIFISLLLGGLLFINIRVDRSYFDDIHTAQYFLLGAVYFISMMYVWMLKRSKNIRFQAYLQLLIDVLIITALIYATGGIESIFSFLYILSIFSGSILLFRKGGMFMASISSISYGLLLDFHYYGVIHPLSGRLSYPEQYQGHYLFLTIVANMAAFYLVGYLSSFLSEQARKSRAELQDKESDLTRLEALHETIIGSLTSGLIVLDNQERIILFNPAAERLFGLSAVQVTGHPIRDHLPWLSELLNSPPPVSTDPPDMQVALTDISYQPAAGEERHLQVSVSQLEVSPADPRGRILILQDVTRLKHIQEEMKQVEGLALIGELAAGMAHEIRNPMASISGSIQMLRDEIQQSDINTRLMDIVLRETDRLNGLISDFLLYARAQRPKVTEFDLNHLIIESLELFQNSQDCHPGTDFLTDLQKIPTVESDPDQLKQVLWNIFLNASEAMDGKGTLHIATSTDFKSYETERGQIKVVIRDTGKGFDEKDLPRVFLPFFTTKERGSGLGLAIVKRIVDSLDGKISGRNHPSGGAEITISLPIRPNARKP